MNQHLKKMYHSFKLCWTCVLFISGKRFTPQTVPFLTFLTLKLFHKVSKLSTSLYIFPACIQKADVAFSTLHIFWVWWKPIHHLLKSQSKFPWAFSASWSLLFFSPSGSEDALIPALAPQRVKQQIRVLGKCNTS